MTRTDQQFDKALQHCRDLFEKKMIDYGTAWRIMRLASLVDQLYIKANRIRTLEEAAEQKVGDSIESEYVGIVNYSIMALIQLEWEPTDEPQQDAVEVLSAYDHYARAAKGLMLAKNHDYGEAWRMMQRTSLTDLILMKIYRLKQILQNQGKTLVSEGVDANFMDMINYAIFALIKMEEQKVKPTPA